MSETARNKEATSNQAPKKPLPSLDEQLTEKQDQLKSAQEASADLQVEIKELQAKIAEFKQATANYEDISKAAKEQKVKLSEKIDSQVKIAMSIIGEPKAEAIDKQVDNKIKEFRDALTKQRSETGQARINAKSANDDWLEAKNAFQEQQAIYDLVKKQPNDTGASLKEVQNLIFLAENAHDKDEHEQMYLLAQIAKKAIIDNIEIPSLDKYSAELLAAQNEATNKKRNTENKKTIADQKAVTFTELSKKYEAASASSRANLLDALKKITPAADA